MDEFELQENEIKIGWSETTIKLDEFKMRVDLSSFDRVDEPSGGDYFKEMGLACMATICQCPPRSA